MEQSMTTAQALQLKETPTGPASLACGFHTGMCVWVNGIPYRLTHHVIGVTWAAAEIFGSRSRFVQTTECRECRLHGRA
jgi:hypothetical protein